MKRVGITVDGPDLHEALALELRELNAEVFVVPTLAGDARLDRHESYGDFAFEQLLHALREGAVLAERSALRAALALDAHCRRGAGILVSDDLAAFGRDGSARRKVLEELIGTPILSAEQFRHWAGVSDRRAA